MTRAAARLGWLGAAALLSCNTNFAPQYLVRDLRILAVRAEVVGDGAEQADADAGQTVRLTALVANPERLAVTVRWKACLPQQGEAVSPCLDTSVLRDPDSLSGPGVVDLGEGASVSVTVPPELQPALQALIDRAKAQPSLACTLYAELPVVVIASAPGAQTRIAVKTARLTPWREVANDPSLARAYVRNRNPSLAAVRASPIDPDACVGGSPVARACTSDDDCGGGTRCLLAAPGASDLRGQCADGIAPGEQPLCARPADNAVQIYQQCSEDGTRQQFFEDLTFQWYTTAGVLKNSEGNAPGAVGNVTDDRVTFTAPSGSFTMWVIIRDGRGGEDWLERDFP